MQASSFLQSIFQTFQNYTLSLFEKASLDLKPSSVRFYRKTSAIEFICENESKIAFINGPKNQFAC